MNNKDTNKITAPALKGGGLQQKLFYSHLQVVVIGLVLLGVSLASILWLRSYTLQLAAVRGPSVDAILLVRNGTYRSLAALRAWITLGDEKFKDDRFIAWNEEIHPALETLKSLGSPWIEAEHKKQLPELPQLLSKLEEAQWWIEDVAQTPGNEPARDIFIHSVRPISDVISNTIVALIKIEKSKVVANEKLLDWMVQAQLTFNLSQMALSNFVRDADNVDEEQFFRTILESHMLFIKIANMNPPLLVEQKKMVKLILVELLAVEYFARQAIDLRKSDSWNVARYLLATQAIPVAERVTELLGKMSSEQLRLMHAEANRVTIVSNTSIGLALILIMTMGIFAGIISRNSARRITQPITELAILTDQLVSGNHQKEHHVSGKDEIDWLNNSIKNLHSVRLSVESSEARLKHAQSIANMGIWDWDIAGNKIFWSDEQYKIFGVKQSKQNISYETFIDAVYSDDREFVQKQLDAALNDDIEYKTDFRIVLPSGEIRYIHGQGDVLRKMNGDAVRFVGTNLDITERKRMEESLKGSEAMLAKAQYIASVGSWEIDTHLNRRIWSDEMCNIFEVESEKSVDSYEAYLELIHPDDRKYFDEIYTDAINEHKQHYDIEHRLLMKDGRVKHLHQKCENIFDGDGELVRCVGIVSDITERVRAEKALKESEEKYFDLYNNAPDMYASILPEDATILYCNQTLANALGYNMDEIIGKEIYNFYHPDCLDKSEEIFQRFVSGLPITDTELQLKRKDGSRLDVSLSVTAARDDHGKILYSRSVWRDITERKQAQDEIKQSQKQLRELANKLQMVREEERTNISREIHDQLGQTLNFLKMDLAWILEHSPSGQKELRERARKTLVLMDETLEGVRRMSDELRPPMLDELGLDAAIEHEIEVFNQRTGRTCDCKLELNMEDIGLDQVRDTAVFRIFQEALSNIAQHAQADLIKVSLSAADSQLVLSIEDNGTGISKKKINHHESIGIISMRERCESIGGTFQIAAIDAGGTRVICSVPLSGAA